MQRRGGEGRGQAEEEEHIPKNIKLKSFSPKNLYTTAQLLSHRVAEAPHTSCRCLQTHPVAHQGKLLAASTYHIREFLNATNSTRHDAIMKMAFFRAS